MQSTQEEYFCLGNIYIDLALCLALFLVLQTLTCVVLLDNVIIHVSQMKILGRKEEVGVGVEVL